MDGAIRETPHVLVVDDDKILLDLMATMLEHLGYNVTTCTKETDAICLYRRAHACQENCFDLVFLDLCMSRMTSGIDILKELQKINTDITAVCFTGDTQNIDLSKHGFAHVLLKPITLSHLRDAMHNILPTYQNT